MRPESVVLRRPRFALAPLAAHVLPPALLIAAILALGEWAARAGVSPAALPAPSEVGRAAWHDAGALLSQTLPTLLVAIYGFLAAAALSLALAFAVYAVRRIETTVMTCAAVLSSIPVMAIAPMLLIWMGPSVATRIAITAVICVFPILVSVVQGIRAVSKQHDELFMVMASTPWQRFTRLALPVAVPYVFVGLRIAAPLSILGALVAEWNGADTGLGVIMINAMFSLQIERLWTTVGVACSVSLLAYGYVCMIERLAVSADRVVRRASV